MIIIKEYTQEEYERDIQELIEKQGLKGAIEIYLDKINEEVSGLSYIKHRTIQEYLCDILYIAEKGVKHEVDKSKL